MPESKKRSQKPPKKKTTTTKKKQTQQKAESKYDAPKEKTGTQTEFDEENLGDRLSAIAQKAYDAVKDGVQKLSDFASESSQVAKIKFEILNLSSDRKSLLREVGQKLWKLHKAKSLANIEEKFQAEFNKIAELEKKIAAKEREAETVSKKVK